MRPILTLVLILLMTAAYASADTTAPPIAQECDENCTSPAKSASLCRRSVPGTCQVRAWHAPEQPRD